MRLFRFRVRWKLTYCLLVSLLLVCILSGPFLKVQDDIQTADAIVVIGGDHKPERVERAVELYRQAYAQVVIISAGTIVLEGDEFVPEAEVMRRQALALGLPEKAMVLETHSFSTFENAYYSKQICREHGLDSILLVTSAHHSRRARRIFRDTFEPGISVSVQPASQDCCELCWWLHPDRVYVVLHEYKNWMQYWLAHAIN
jgi:uncharacterized SAM-binding protein YcdF (DUF218 family)